MDKVKKRQIRKYISMACAVLAVALLAAMPLLARSSAEASGPQASILTGTAETGDIQTVLAGGGTLAEEEAGEVTLPAGVLLTEFLVSNGDRVSAGDPVAAVDRVSLMDAITQVQASLDHLAEQIEEARDREVTDKITAPAGGRVKLVYAQPGDDVRQVMLDHGALAVLSLDGLMAVDIASDAPVAVGDSVSVALDGGEPISGRIAAALNGTVTVTVTDEGYAPGGQAAVSLSDGTALGSGALYINSPWNATAFAGTVDAVRVEAEDTVSAGRTLLTFRDTAYTAEFETLSAQRREYEDKMFSLFQLYQTLELTAPCDGVVDGVDEDSAHLLAGDGSGWFFSRLVNAPDGSDGVTYHNYLGMVTATALGSWVLQMDAADYPITDYADLTGLTIDPAAMTNPSVYVPTAPVYEREGDTWKQLAPSDVTAGDVLLFAAGEDGVFVWVVRVQRGSGESPTQPTVPSELPQPTEPVAPSEPTVPSEATTPSEPAESTTPSLPADGTVPTIPSYPDFQFPQIGGGFSGMGGYSQGGGTAEPEFELYALEEDTLLTVTPQDTMTLSITLDERDISNLYLGQTAQIKVDALRGEEFTGTITAIGSTGANSGGSSKFTAELTLDRAEGMLSGMSATALLPLDTVQNVVTVPVAALVEDGARTLVYTSCDPDKETLGDPVEVTTGVSDGENVQILSGLTSGDRYCYAYYDTLELSNIPDRNPFG